MSPATFAVAENQIYNDANQSGRTPVAPEGQLVPYYTTVDAGRRNDKLVRRKQELAARVCSNQATPSRN